LRDSVSGHFTVSGEISRVRAIRLFGETLADHGEDLALPRCECVAGTAAGLRMAGSDVIVRAGGQPRTAAPRSAILPS
jgi:hypothetical protein